jgi:hypothetical protein
MFQNLSQGASVTLFYRNEPRIITGKVASVNTHMPTYNPNQPMAMFNGLVTDITVQAGNESIPFAGLPANGVVADFPSKGMFLAIDSAAAYREVDTAIAAFEQDLATVPEKQRLLEGYKKLRLEKNPEARREAEWEKERAEMRGQIEEMKQMLSAVLGSKAKEK